MKRLVAIIILITVACSWSSAQVYKDIDQDISDLRDNAFPGLRYHLDDYLQYGPAIVVYGMRSLGYEGRSTWPTLATNTAFSSLLYAGVNNLLKASVDRMRPNNRRNNSWPSGHTGTAFMTATIMHKEYGWRSPWWSVGAYTTASVVGVSRILNNYHWLTDVISGAILGVTSTNLGYWLGDLIYGPKAHTVNWGTPDYQIDRTYNYYSADLYFAKRYILNPDANNQNWPSSSSSVGLQLALPLDNGTGLLARVSANVFTCNEGQSDNMYNILTGAYKGGIIGSQFDYRFYAMAGYASHPLVEGINFDVGTSLGVFTAGNFRIESMLEYEYLNYDNDNLHSLILGCSAGFVF